MEHIKFDDPNYVDLLSHRTETAKLYDGLPLSQLCMKLRGSVMEAIVRRHEDTCRTTRDPDRERDHSGAMAR